MSKEIEKISRRSHLVYVLWFILALIVPVAFSAALLLTLTVDTFWPGWYFVSAVLFFLPVGIMIGLLLGVLIHRLMLPVCACNEDKQVAISSIPQIGRKLRWVVMIVTATLLLSTMFIYFDYGNKNDPCSYPRIRTVDNLRTISSQQVNFHQEHGRYGTLIELAEADMILPCLRTGRDSAYIYSLAAGTETRSCLAVPIDRDKLYYKTIFRKPHQLDSWFINEVGKLRRSSPTPWRNPALGHLDE